MNICITQNYKDVLNELPILYGGKVYKHGQKSGEITSYRYIISKKIEILNMLNFYFILNPSNTIKQDKLNLIKIYYSLIEKKANKAPIGSSLNKE